MPAPFRCAAAALIAFAISVESLPAQIAQQNTLAPEQITRFSAALNLQFTEPKEEFRENVGNGFGGGGFIRYNVDRAGVFSLRLDLSAASYGSEKKRVPLSSTVGGRILVDVVTTNSIFAFGLGAQLTAPSGSVRPYANVGFSGLDFSTTTSVSGSNSSDEPFASTTNYSDGTAAWVFGSGLYIPVSRRVNIELGARYHRGGQASYLREGSIQDNPDGSVTITPLQSRTPFMQYLLGASFQLSRRSLNPCPRALC